MLSRLSLAEIVGRRRVVRLPARLLHAPAPAAGPRGGLPSACSVRDAMSGPGDDPFARARIVVRGGTSVEELGGFAARASRRRARPRPAARRLALRPAGGRRAPRPPPPRPRGRLEGGRMTIDLRPRPACARPSRWAAPA